MKLLPFKHSWKKLASSLALLSFLTLSCDLEDTVDARQASFAEDLAFLSKHTEVIVLSDETENARVIVIPAMQARIMTSTFAGGSALSLGWINRELIASGETLPHFNPYGGEDRFWLGPEGGQYALFFAKDAPFDLENWNTPAAIDTEPFELISSSRSAAHFKRSMALTNYGGVQFVIDVERKISLLTTSDIFSQLNIPADPEISAVAFESDNTIVNAGKEPWRKATGLVSIWILGMFNPSPYMTVVLPYIPGDAAALGPVVNDSYFGKVPTERLHLGQNAIYFKGDGKYRSKIGLSAMRAKPVMGSYDAQNQVLTLVQYSKPEAVADYVNSMWEIQAEPYQGDVVNSYNDGPPEPGAKPLGPFYELESSSSAAELAPGEQLTHVHRTFHLHGPEANLDRIARQTLGVSLQQIISAFR